MYHFWYHFCFEFSSTRIKCAVVLVIEMNHFYCFNICDNIKVMCVGGRCYYGWQWQPGGGDDGGQWHHDVSLQLESLVFYSSLFASFSALMMSWTLELSHTLKLSKIWISHHQHSLSHTHPHWWTFKLKCYIKMSPTSLVSSTRLSLPTTMSMTLTTNTHVLNDVRHVESIKIFDVDPDHHSIWHPSWRKFQPKLYILM